MPLCVESIGDTNTIPARATSLVSFGFEPELVGSRGVATGKIFEISLTFPAPFLDLF